jgi:hypothetical protein
VTVPSCTRALVCNQQELIVPQLEETDVGGTAARGGRGVDGNGQVLAKLVQMKVSRCVLQHYVPLAGVHVKGALGAGHGQCAQGLCFILERLF